MTTRVPVEEIEVSTGEKVLAVMLAVFISVGAIWAYVRIDDIGTVAVQPTPAEQTAIEANEAASRAHFRAQREVRAAYNEVARTREAYRTALDARSPQLLSNATTSVLRQRSTTRKVAWRPLGQR